MPIYSVQGPDGRIYDVEGPAGASEESVLAAVKRQYLLSAPAQPKEDTKGFKAAAAAGIERLKGETALTAGKLGLMDTAEAEKYQKAQEAKAAARFTPTEDGWTESPWQKLKETAGGSVPYLLAPAAAGVAAAAAPVAAPVAAGLGLAGAGALSAGQFTGTNLARQMDTGKSLEETSLGAAVGAAVPQALMDTAAMALLPGIGKLFGSVGSKLTKAEAKAIADQTLGRAAADYAAKTGAAMGREGLTETAQQVLERLQAGLSITDPEARKEYIDSFVGGAALAGVGAPAGRYLERSAAKPIAAEAKAEEQKLAAQQAEAAKEAQATAPEALIALDDQYRAAQQQMAALDAAVAQKPKKGSAPEERKAYADGMQQAQEFKKATFDPLTEQYEKRKPLIDKLYEERAAALEAQTGAEQPAQKYASTDYPDSQPYEQQPVTRLMEQHGDLRQQMGQLEDQLVKATPQEYTALHPQYEALKSRMDEMGKAIETRGGVAASEKDFAKQVATETKKFQDLQQNGDFAAAKKQADKLADMAQKQKMLDEVRTNQEQRGQTRDLFTPEQAPVPVAETPAEAMAVEAPAPVEAPKVAAPERVATPESTATAEKTYAEIQKLTPQVQNLQGSNRLENADKIAKLQTLQKSYEEQTRPALDRDGIDLFSPQNIINTAIQNGDQATLDKIVTAQKQERRKTELKQRDDAAAERERLLKSLDERLNLTGQKVERTATPEEYDKVMEDIDVHKRAIENAQGNAKKSVLEELYDLTAEHEALTKQLESNVATPSLREKAVHIGKGTEPAPRQMSAFERHNVNRKLLSVAKRYQHLVDTKVAPAREAIVKLHQSLYKVAPAAKASDLAQAKQDESNRRAREPKISRAAKTAARINAGNMTKEAAKTEALEKLAFDIGTASPEYEKLVADQVRRLGALQKKYGEGDKAVTAYRIEVSNERDIKAREIGRKSPEYKKALKEQAKKLTEAVQATGPLTPASQRTKQETRKVNRAPKEERTSSPESRAASDKRHAGKAMSVKEQERIIKEVNDEEGGTAYRVRESEGGVVDAKEAADFMAKVQSNLPDNVKLVYAATPGKIPVRLLTMMKNEGVNPTEAMVQGAVFSDGTVLVVGDQHADLKDLEETVLHELVGHYGIDTLIGTDRLQSYANNTDLRALAEQIGGADLLAEVTRVAQANAALGRSEAVQKLQVLREIIAHTEEARVTEAFKQKAGRWIKELVGMVRAGLRKMGFTNSSSLSTSDVFYALRESRKAFANKTIGPYKAANGEIAFRSKTDPSEPSSFIASKTSFKDRLMANVMGLAGRVQYVDQYAALSESFKRGMDKGVISSAEAQNAEFLIRFGQNVSQYAQQFLTNGRVQYKTVTTNGVTEKVFESTKGPSMIGVAEKLHKGKFENDTQAEAMLTAYIAGLRAEAVGWDKLNYKNPAAVKKEYDERMAALASNPEQMAAVKEAAAEYQEYNNGLLDFAVQTGEMTKAKADALKKIPYVPFYRVDGDSLNLYVAGEKPMRIGNIKDQPELKELVGGADQIQPIFTGAVQNTFILTRMALRNAMMKDNAFVLHKLGIASKIGPGNGPTGRDTVRFKVKGVDHFAVIDTDMYGIPAELIVKGMEGIKTTMPAAIRLMGYPADVLRKFVTRNPAYAIRQVIRDPLNAWLTTGTDAMPVLSSMKELASMVAGRSENEAKLMSMGAISSNVFSGNSRDMDMFLRDIAAGKSGWDKVMAKADAFAMQGDAATRAVIYKDSIDKGMSEQQALLRTLESMNFGRRGLSPSMQALSTVIPFFNAQIQGLDVLYRAFTNQMPFSEQLKIKQKLMARGLMLAMGTLAYAAVMSDDEAYKRAKPEERYGNWFVYIPGLDEPMRVPIPFELGYLFKALPEAIFNMAANDEKASKAVGGFVKLIGQSNPFGLPQAIKPVTEVILGKSFFGGDIESAREKQLLPAERYRDNSTELAKLIGSVTASSPVKALTGKEGLTAIDIDYLIRGYTGGLGIALVQLANPLLNTEMSADVAKPSLKLSKTPFIGGLFQPVEGRGTLDEAYDTMNHLTQVQKTYKDKVDKGERAEAMAFAQENATQLAMASTSGQVYKLLGELAKQERMIKASPQLTTEQKDDRLKRIDQMKVNYARKFLAMADKTTPQ